MRKISFNLKYIAVALLAISIGSCDALLDDSVTDYGKGPNLVGFDKGTAIIKAEAWTIWPKIYRIRAGGIAEATK